MAINAFLSSVAGFFGESRGGARRRRVGCGYGINPAFTIVPGGQPQYLGPDAFPPTNLWGEIHSYGPSPFTVEFIDETTSRFPLVFKQWGISHWQGGSLLEFDLLQESDDPPGPLVFNDDWGCTRRMLLSVQDTKLAQRPGPFPTFWRCEKAALFHTEAALRADDFAANLPQLHFSAPGWPHTDPFGPLVGRNPIVGPAGWEWVSPAEGGFVNCSVTAGTGACANEPNYWLCGFSHPAFDTTIVWRSNNRLDPRGVYDRIFFQPGTPPEDPSNTLTITIS